jgi:hypothetical protein
MMRRLNEATDPPFTVHSTLVISYIVEDTEAYMPLKFDIEER